MTMLDYGIEMQNALVKLNKQSWAMVNMMKESNDAMSENLLQETAGDAELKNLKLAEQTIRTLSQLFGRL